MRIKLDNVHSSSSINATVGVSIVGIAGVREEKLSSTLKFLLAGVINRHETD